MPAKALIFGRFLIQIYISTLNSSFSGCFEQFYFDLKQLIQNNRLHYRPAFCIPISAHSTSKRKRRENGSLAIVTQQNIIFYRKQNFIQFFTSIVSKSISIKWKQFECFPKVFNVYFIITYVIDAAKSWITMWANFTRVSLNFEFRRMLLLVLHWSQTSTSHIQLYRDRKKTSLSLFT